MIISKKALTNAFATIQDDVVIVEFYGSGDSGEVHHWNTPEAFKDLADAIINFEATFDWWNNEGGGGSVTFIRHGENNEPEVRFSGYYNVSDQEVLHDNERVDLDAYEDVYN